MGADLDKTLKNAGYSALPLPRGGTGPTTIIAYRGGQLYVVRNPQTCLKIAVTPETAADTLQFTREFNFGLNGVVDLLSKLFGLGKAKGELDIHNVRSATVQLGGLSHETIPTGDLVDYLVALPDSSCKRDVLDPDHFTIVAALKANSFRFTFKNQSGTTVKLSASEATGLFTFDAGVTVQVSESGEIVVQVPAYVGVITWDGRTTSREIQKAQKPSKSLTRSKREPASNLERLLAKAMTPADLERRRAASLKPGRKPSAARASGTRRGARNPRAKKRRP